jgi:hypothetical protein
MNLRGILCCFLIAAAARALQADNTPSVEIFTGWSWMPYPCGYPYRQGYPYGWGPSCGIAHPLNGFDRPYDPYFYGDPYGPYWGYGYGVRYRLKPDRYFSGDSERDLSLLPGSAPTELLSATPKTAWDKSIDAFIHSPGSSATNAPPPQPRPNER